MWGDDGREVWYNTCAGRAERLRKTRYVIGEYERWGTRCGEINVMRGEWRAYGHATEYVESARARERQADAQ